MDRRNFVIGGTVLTLGALTPLPHDKAEAFIFGLIFRFLLRTGFRRGIARTAFRSGSSVARNARRSQFGTRQYRPAPKTLRTGAGNKVLRHPNSFNAKKALVEEVAIELGMRMILPEEMGLNLPGVVGISERRAEQYKKHNADCLWITDEVNSADVQVANLSSKKVIDALNIELWSDRKTDGPIDVKKRLLRAEPDSESMVSDLRYINVPTGQMEIQANPKNEMLLVSKYSGARIVGVRRDEIISVVAS